MRTKGSSYREPLKGQPNYLVASFGKKEGSNTPFPGNTTFTSEPVLSEEAREMIWVSVMRKGMPLKAVSAQFHVDMRRVAAVVRMKEIEKKWVEEVSFFSSLFFFLVSCTPVGFCDEL